ncbi:hypothetical protein SARC_04081 [Sphaeroforma arctica JP610]|uniref:Uncharacterized protein n=1 Tax=Sphaeroforma arctica JP610 TaxID=667725 RepID=A0A0L0G646_9EUKA|nr:hypothetical protein SARC_04081 [Sphaeroforma arctica JP610]KNC83683.1 hypothetical protein SARC_04081 [Sphaeroforma arctica JP610]|eukprot:XP_014157585.1 hypothetical protein SARC_04081 [Sphaeroforma arctica JP610]
MNHHRENGDNEHCVCDQTCETYFGIRDHVFFGMHETMLRVLLGSANTDYCYWYMIDVLLHGADEPYEPAPDIVALISKTIRTDKSIGKPLPRILLLLDIITANHTLFETTELGIACVLLECGLDSPSAPRINRMIERFGRKMY